MGKPMNLRAAAGLAIFLLVGCVTGGGLIRDANAQSTPLHEAALSGRFFTIHLLLADGANVNAWNEDGLTPLHQAALFGNMASVQTLLVGGAGADVRSKDGFTPLHMAVLRKTLLAMLEADADGSRDERALFRAMVGLDKLNENERGIFERELGIFRRKVFAVFFKSGTDERIDMVRTLLVGGANINARGADGITPLHVAAFSGDAAAIHALLVDGANVDARAKDGFTPLHGVARLGDVAAAIHALLAGGANVNARSLDGFTPLHGVAVLGDVAAVRALLAGGADVNARSNDGFTPLHTAVSMKTLLAALEANAYGSFNELSRAGLSRALSRVMGRDTLNENERETSAAFLKGFDDDRTDTVRALLAGGANINARSKDGFTPLYVAAVSGDAAAVKALLDAGGNPNAVALGCGPMDVARLRMESTESSIAPFQESIAALRAAGARPREGCRP